MILRHDGTAERRFGWRATAAVLRELEAAHPGARLLPAARGFVLRQPSAAAAEDCVRARVVVPAVLRLRTGETSDELLCRLDAPLGDEVVVLLRAGAAALGLWRDGELHAHKVFTRYVVRGHGKAQPTYRKTKGKSRYGARLRLQQARALLVEVNERLAEWWQTCGGLDAVFVACPERLWVDVRAAEPTPGFWDACAPTRIPLHVHAPRHAELLRVRWHLEHGTVAFAPA